jgi:hypothetical protein
MPNPWTHAICDGCWKRRQPGRVPVRVREPGNRARCCYCGKATASGIFVRDEPTTPTHPKGHTS